MAELVTLEAEVKSDETTSLNAANQPIQGRIQIHKTDALTGEALAGAEFTITRMSGLPSHNGEDDDEVVAVITTDEKGTAITPWLTWGTYRVEETGVPEHFVDNHYVTEVIIDREDLQAYSIEVENEPTMGWIRLTKMDSLDGHSIAGVTFNIYYLADADPRNMFHVERYLSTRLKLREDDVYPVYEVEVGEEDEQENEQG